MIFLLKNSNFRKKNSFCFITFYFYRLLLLLKRSKAVEHLGLRPDTRSLVWFINLKPKLQINFSGDGFCTEQVRCFIEQFMILLC